MHPDAIARLSLLMFRWLGKDRIIPPLITGMYGMFKEFCEQECVTVYSEAAFKSGWKLAQRNGWVMYERRNYGPFDKGWHLTEAGKAALGGRDRMVTAERSSHAGEA